MSKHSSQLNPRKAALTGLLFTLPFVTANFIISLRIEPVYSFLDSFPFIRNSAFTPLFLLLFFPVGAFIAIRPMVQKNPGGKRKIYGANITIAVVMIIIFLLFTIALSGDLYRCEVLKIPNCD